MFSMMRVCVASSFEKNKSMKLSMSSLAKPRIIVERGRGGIMPQVWFKFLEKRIVGSDPL